MLKGLAPLTICAIVLVICGTALAQDSKKVKPEAVDVDSPMPVFKGIENAWKNADSEKLSSYAGEAKIYLNVEGMDKDPGYFSKSQFYYLFKKMFVNNRQTKFVFVRYHNIDRSDRKVFGIAHRNYKNSRSGKLFQDKVYVTLKKEGERWVVAEIKTTS
jgi:hypothetical protein